MERGDLQCGAAIMFIFVARYVARAAAVLLVVSFVTFALVYGNGPGVARSVLASAVGQQPSDAQVRAEETKLGLDQPLVVQYGKWLRGVVTGNLGDSFYTGQSVTSILASRLPVTLTLVVLTLILTIIVSVLVGIAAAVYGGWIDRVVQVLAVLGTAIPAYIIAIWLVFAFAVSHPLFPATGYVPLETSVGGWLRSVTLPVLALLIGGIAGAAAQFRGAVLDTLSRDFVRTLRARGISERQIIFRHVLRNSAGPGLTVLSLGTIALVGGTVIVEQVFALPGMGSLINSSAQTGDVPIVMACVLLIGVVVQVVNLAADLATAALNPKART
jgi:peptide/nickel transport system permease protein